MFSLITSAIGIIKNVLALFSKNKSTTDVSTNDLNMAEIQKSSTGKGWRFYLGCVAAFVLLWLYVIHPYLSVIVYHLWGVAIVVPPLDGIFSVLIKLL
ncbi:hypothetical protein DCF38_10880 [Edwardsiella piscicida]|uniref:hypothetical protein n=1 Tax=Edwardsiella piscicida TaxID=1263550 RepID=UPI0010573AD9|nr:hypothetical protein [Edwardsiella piscicida]UCQ40040.1 hypothetical protein DCF38_10880 [Edwardsiella piscicida]